MKSGRFEHRSCINAIVEEYDQRGSPVMPNGERLLPASWSLQLIRGKVESIQVRLGQIVASCDISLRLGLGKSGKFL